MRTMRLADSAKAAALIQDNVPAPQPGPGELLIRVCAAGAILAELSWYPTVHDKGGAARIRAVPGHEFSGVVTALGDGVGELELGREVYGMNDWFSDGALAEYCVAPFFTVAPKPNRLSHAEAASVPISALTAWQGLYDHAKLRPGERVLVHGGAGAVGAYAIQLARLHGAQVKATASEHDSDYVCSLGADQVIDHHQRRFEEFVDEMDVVFDTVGGETLQRSWNVLKPNGRMVTVASNAESSTDPRAKKAFFIVEPNQKQLFEIAAMLDARRLRTAVDQVVPLSEAPQVYAGQVPRRHPGKIVIAIDARTAA